MTLKRYAIDYNDGCYPPEHVGTWYTRAHDKEHALDKFYDSSDEDGFKPTRIAIIPEGRETLTHTWRWGAIS